MSEFGDADPEDAWDPDDPLPELVHNILRRVLLLVALHHLRDRDQQRLELIRDDLGHILNRAREVS